MSLAACYRDIDDHTPRRDTHDAEDMEVTGDWRACRTMGDCERGPIETEGRSPRITERQSRMPRAKSLLLLSLLASTVPVATAQTCISLKGSTQCPAFN